MIFKGENHDMNKEITDFNRKHTLLLYHQQLCEPGLFMRQKLVLNSYKLFMRSLLSRVNQAPPEILSQLHA